MRHISVLNNIVGPILLAGLVCGIAGVVHAQLAIWIRESMHGLAGIALQSNRQCAQSV